MDPTPSTGMPSPPQHLMIVGIGVPIDPMRIIFSYLNKCDTPKARLVAKGWRQLLTGDHLDAIYHIKLTRFLDLCKTVIKTQKFPEVSSQLHQLIKDINLSHSNSAQFKTNTLLCKNQLLNILSQLPQKQIDALMPAARSCSLVSFLESAKTMLKVRCYIRMDAIQYFIPTIHYLDQYEKLTGRFLIEGGCFVAVEMESEKWISENGEASPRRFLRYNNISIPTYLFLDHLQDLKNGDTFDLCLENGHLLRAICASDPQEKKTFEECVQIQQEKLFKSWAQDNIIIPKRNPKPIPKHPSQLWD